MDNRTLDIGSALLWSGLLALALGFTVFLALRLPATTSLFVAVLGSGCFLGGSVFNRRASSARASMESDLRRAVARKQLVLEFQPVLDLTNGCITGTEALLRWDHPSLGRLAPADFVSIAEDAGTIHAIGEWVLRAACAQLTLWLSQGVRDHRMMINVSAIQLRAATFAADVERVLAEFNVPPHLVELELTETQIMNDMPGACVFFRRMKALGVRTSLDDFGVGYNSLTYLKTFQFDTIKIDRSFVSEICDDTIVHDITRTVTTLGHDLGMTVVAEGVETTAQLQALAALGCDEAQGFLLGIPLSSGKCTELLVRQSALNMRGSARPRVEKPRSWMIQNA